MCLRYHSLRHNRAATTTNLFRTLIQFVHIGSLIVAQHSRQLTPFTIVTLQLLQPVTHHLHFVNYRPVDLGCSSLQQILIGITQSLNLYAQARGPLVDTHSEKGHRPQGFSRVRQTFGQPGTQRRHGLHIAGQQSPLTAGD